MMGLNQLGVDASCCYWPVLESVLVSLLTSVEREVSLPLTCFVVDFVCIS